MSNRVVLRMQGICMTFPGVKALDHVDLTLREGEIHALMGENGAGKSTLIKCLTGVNDHEKGEIFMGVEQRPIKNRSTMEAQRNGISTVYQEVNLCPNLSVAENLFIGREPMTRFGTIDHRAMLKRSRELVDRLDIHVDVTKTLEHYSIALQQMIAIARAVDMDCKVLILDEPTRGIDVGTKTEIQKLVIELAAQGKSVLFISSEIGEMLRTCSRLAVLRDGEKVGELTGELTQEKVMREIAGGERA